MTKERLKNYQALKAESEQLREKLEEIEASLYHPKVQRLTGMPGGGQEKGNAQETLIAKHIELQELYNAKLQELTKEQLAIERAIDTLDPGKRMLLRYRYIDGLKWEAVCVRMDYSWTQVHYHHSEALKQLRENSE